MTAQFSIGERVAQMVGRIENFYGLDKSTPLAEMVAARAFETNQRLARLQAKPSQAKPSQAKPSQERIRVAIKIKGFDVTAKESLEQTFPALMLVQPSEAEIIIADPHASDLNDLLSADALRVFWAHDHHHSFHHYAMFLLKANIVIPAHFHRRDHLTAFNTHIADTVPATTNQWTRTQIETYASQTEKMPRSDLLYGGFGAYDVGLERSLFIGSLMERLPEHALSVRHIQSADDPYFSQSDALRYTDWRGYKVSLAAAINQDIPIRIFDALAAGQIPIIPNSVTNLGWIIPVEDQTRLGIERFASGNPDSALAAWRRAVENFDRMGASGVQARIDFFLNRHSLESRVERMIRTVLRSCF